jgi:hypothetical protein
MISLLLLSLGVTSLVAFLIAFGFWFIAPNVAYAIFWITFGLEWVIMEPVNWILRKRALKEEGKTLAKLEKYEKAVGKQTVALECEYCGEPNAIKVDLNNANAFICTKCGNGNKVAMSFSTVRTTDPLDTIAPVDAETIIDELEEKDD